MASKRIDRLKRIERPADRDLSSFGGAAAHVWRRFGLSPDDGENNHETAAASGIKSNVKLTIVFRIINERLLLFYTNNSSRRINITFSGIRSVLMIKHGK